MPSRDWHWEQGIKYATEAIKAALLLNGAAAIALMIFGNTRQFSLWLVWPLLAFALGAACATGSFFFAYLAQLEYGNAEPEGDANDEPTDPFYDAHKRAVDAHYWTLITALASVVLFVIGVVLAALVLPQVPAH
jgi:hypothetical protein